MSFISPSSCLYVLNTSSSLYVRGGSCTTVACITDCFLINPFSAADWPTESNRRLLVETGAIPVFIGLLGSADVEIKYFSGAALSNLAVDGVCSVWRM